MYRAGICRAEPSVARGETTAAALGRELAEETGLRAHGDLPLFGLYGRFQDGVSDHVAVHLVRDWTGPLAVDEREVVDARFVAPDRAGLAAAGLVLSPGTARRIAEWHNGTPPSVMW